ncbi:MAG: PEP-CTERM sorting domain-containing protein [Planctomycetota bacterium]
MNTLKLSFATVILAAWMPMASAAPLLDQEFDAFAAGSSGGATLIPRQILYQTFTVGLGGTLASVELQAQQDFDTPTDDLVVSILATSGGTPDPATVLGSVSVPPGAVPPADFSNVPFFSVDLSGLGIAVTPGEQLAIRLSQASADSRYFWYEAEDFVEEEEGTPPPSGFYAGGASFVGSDLASIPFVNTRVDVGFRTFVEPVVIPEPTSAGLLSMLFLGAYARRRREA